MYESFYGLRERPFNLLPDPRFLFLSKQHTEALTHLQYGLSGRPGVTVLIGEAGTGKTTLVRKALEAAPDRRAQSRIAQLSNPTLTRAEFYEYLAAAFGFTPEAGSSKPRFLFELETVLSEHAGVVALVVDEAQSLPHDLLEEIRLLTNLQTASGRALTMVLVGQPELGHRLNEGRMRQLKQRVALRCELAPLDLRETLAYVAKRVAVAGGAADRLFTVEAVYLVHERSRGIPRTISVLCDNALVNGLAANVKPVGPSIIEDVCRDFQIGWPPSNTATTPDTTTVGSRRAGMFADPDLGSDHVAETPASADTSGSADANMFSGFSKKKRFSIF